MSDSFFRQILENMEKRSENVDIKKPAKLQPLQSILVNAGSVDDDEHFFRAPMRPRAMTDPISPRPCHHVRFDLPDIIVDDCSDNDESNIAESSPDEISKELANTNEGAFFVFKSPPRQRSNTCPSNMFSKRRERKYRPPTPPPSDRIPLDAATKYPSWEKVDFSRHHLDSVEEVKEATLSSAQDSACSKSTMKTGSQKVLNSKTVKTTVTSSVKETMESSSSSSVSRIVNGHVTSKTNGIRDVIHTSA